MCMLTFACRAKKHMNHLYLGGFYVQNTFPHSEGKYKGRGECLRWKDSPVLGDKRLMEGMDVTGGWEEEGYGRRKVGCFTQIYFLRRRFEQSRVPGLCPPVHSSSPADDIMSHRMELIAHTIHSILYIDVF